MDGVAEARQYFGYFREALQSVDYGEIEKAAALFRDCRERRGTAWIVGNGGSAATASHFANDLIKMGHVNARALSDEGPVITAYGNDLGWNKMYQAFLENLIGPSDVLVAITYSGASQNVLHALGVAWKDRILILTGNCDGWDNEAWRLPCYAKLCVSGEIRIVEDLHLAICHCIAGLVAEGE